MDSMASWEDLQTMVEIAREVLLEERPEVLNDEERRWELEDALERYRAREIARGKPFSRRAVNASFRSGEHLQLMHQRY
jgi:hypothetical protein